MIFENVTYNEWFINQKRLPDKNSQEYKPFFDFHKKLCLDGFMMDGVFINPFLYWHLNLWHTEVDIIDERGRIAQKYANPTLRDNEWLVTNEIDRAHKEKQGLVILGIRRFAKSVIEASYIAMGATLDENSQNVIAGLNAPDIKLITDKLDKGLNFLPEYFRWQRVEDNWKNQVTLGIKTRGGERIPFSQILIRNLDEGNNEEAIAGTKPRKLIIDEIGKGSFLRGLQAAVPGFTTPFGWGCSPILTGCVCAGTKVWNKEGKLVNIETLQQNDGLIGYNGDTVQKQEINWFKKPEIKKSYRIHTDDGSYLDCSYDHPLLMTKRNSYVSKNNVKFKKAIYQETQHLEVNDQLLKPSEVEIFGTKNIYYSRVLGLLIGDGNYSKGSTPVLSCSEKEILEYVKPYTTNKNKEYQINNISSFADLALTPLKPMLISHGMYGQSKDKKRFPSDIHLFDKQSCAELLGGYFDADGNVYYNEKKKIVRIVLTSVIFELLEEAKYLLMKFGVHATIVKEKRKSAPIGYEGQKPFIYRLYINQQQDIKIFRDQIKFLNSSKQEKLNFVKDSKYKKFNCLFEINPLNNKEGYFNSERLQNLRYTTITKIEEIGEQMVYNLNCSPNHNYLSNGLITRQTGGDMKKFMDAKSLMFDVSNYNFLTYNNEDDTKRVHGLFISNKYRMEAKYESSLGEYLNVPKESDLHNVSMAVSDEDKANEITNSNLERLKKAGDRVAYLKEKMYYPQKVDDIFLNEDTNIFDIDSAKRQKTRLLQQDRTGTPVVLFIDEGIVSHEFTDKVPITNFPLKNTDQKDAPVVIYEFPIENPPYGLYVAGVDPYRQGQAKYSTSLGSVYIYKRMHELTGEKYQDMFVASYCARPDKKETWEEQSRLLIKYYNARTLCENDDISFIEYMKAKGDAHYLEKQPQWLHEIVPNTTVKREYGIHRSSQKIIDYMHTCLKRYMEEVVYVEKDEEGNVTREMLGVSKMFDPMLLEEIIQYNDEGNFDRIVSAELALAQALKMDPIMGKIGGSNDDRIKSLYSKKGKNNKLFVNSHNMFNTKKNKLFS
jgi:hypothetical protein